jgi:hypothetical protein
MAFSEPPGRFFGLDEPKSGNNQNAPAGARRRQNRFQDAGEVGKTRRPRYSELSTRSSTSFLPAAFARK